MSEVVRHQISYVDLSNIGWFVHFDREDKYKVTCASLNGVEMKVSDLYDTLENLGLKMGTIDIALTEHRPLTSKAIQYGYVFVGQERTDDVWLKSGYASEAVMEVMTESNMSDMDVQIEKLKNGGD